MPSVSLPACGRVVRAAWAVLGWIAGGTALAAEPAPQAAAAPPNVVLILSDDHAWTDYGFMGHPEIRTPHLDKLASQSATFVQGYVPASLCRPSLATLVTGLYPHQHGIVGNDPPPGQPRESMLKFIRAAHPLPKLLADKGYVSFQSGKWWEGAPAEGGFTAAMSHGDPKRGGRHGDLGLKIGREGLKPIYDFLAGTGGKPFFLWYAPIMPHTPHNPPERLLAKYRRDDVPPSIAKYRAMVEWFDETCGELLTHLDEKGLAENTVVVYVADNGWIQDPAGPGSLLTSKRSPFDGGLRTPILVRRPGKIKPARIETPAGTIDFVPTILAACGITPPTPLPGDDLAAIAAGRPRRESELYGEIFTHDLKSLDRPEAGLVFRWVRDGKWKLIHPENVGTVKDSKYPLPVLTAPRLYDLQADPHEARDLAATHPDEVRTLTEKLDRWWKPFPNLR